MSITVLMIDDEPRVLRAFARNVRLGGYTVITAEGGRAGLELYHQEQPEIVITDLRMPAPSGLDVLQAIRAHDPEANVILVSGHGDQDEILEAMRAGASDFLPKPVDQVTLESALRRAAERVHLKRELRASREALRQQNARLEEEVAKRTAELRQTTRRFQALLDHSPALVHIFDEEGRYLLVGEATAEAMGLAREEMIGKTFADLLPPETVATFMRRVETLKESREVLFVEDQITVKGEEHFFESLLFPLSEEDGGGTYASIAIDVTKRKRAEEALRESEERFRKSFNTEVVAIAISRRRDGMYIEANPGFLKVTGYDYNEIVGHTSQELEFLSPSQRQTLIANLEEKGRLHNQELTYPTRSGELRTILFSIGPITIDNEDCMLATMVDITARKRAEEEQARLTAEVRTQAKQMAQILATVPEGVLLLDATGRVLQANTMAESDLAVLTGVAEGDTLTHLGDRPLAELLTSPPIKGLWHEVEADGRTFEAIARPVENGPEPEQWVLVINDVTEERQIRAQIQQQAQLAAVGQLAAGIAHDFNNIMAVIVLYTQMGLRMPDVPPQLRARLEVMSQQARRATDLIDQILDFGRRAVLKRQPMDLAPFLKEVVKLLERTLPENIKVKLSFDQDEYTINADPTRMQQAIMNLAINARDAMRSQGSGELRIDLARVAASDEIRCRTCGKVLDGDNGAWICITVADNGSGIPPEALPHIFEPFFTTKEVGQGTGLGLSQAFGIVKQHEGHIDVTTQVGGGTTFTLYLPALQVQPSTSPVIERESLIRGQGETVLVVEDNVALRAAMIDILELLNYRALPAADGHAALAVLEQHADEIAVVLSDLVMPEMGGQALFHAMRERGLTLPVVMLSGHPMERELEVLQDQGLAGWILKPLDGDQLAQLLAQVLDKAVPRK